MELLAGGRAETVANSLLEKGASAGMVAENAGDAEAEPMGVGERRAMICLGLLYLLIPNLLPILDPFKFELSIYRRSGR